MYGAYKSSPVSLPPIIIIYAGTHVGTSQGNFQAIETAPNAAYFDTKNALESNSLDYDYLICPGTSGTYATPLLQDMSMLAGRAIIFMSILCEAVQI